MPPPPSFEAVAAPAPAIDSAGGSKKRQVDKAGGEAGGEPMAKRGPGRPVGTNKKGKGDPAKPDASIIISDGEGEEGGGKRLTVKQCTILQQKLAEAQNSVLTEIEPTLPLTPQHITGSVINYLTTNLLINYRPCREEGAAGSCRSQI